MVSRRLSVLAASFAAALSLGMPGRADTPTSDQAQVYESLTTAFTQAAENDDPAAFRPFMTEGDSKWINDDLMRSLFKVPVNIGQPGNVTCGYVCGTTGTTFVQGTHGAYYLNLTLQGDKVAAMVVHGYRDGDTLTVRMPDRTYKAVATTFCSILNSGNFDALQPILSAEELRTFPMDKAAPLFKELSGDSGNISNFTQSGLVGDIATYALTGENGALTLDFSLDTNGKISYMRLRNASSTERTSITKSPDEVTVVVKRLVDSLNAGDFDAVMSLFAANVTGQFPPDQAAQYFGQVTQAAGVINNVTLTDQYGDADTFELAADHGVLSLDVDLDGADKIVWFHLAVKSSNDPKSPVKLPDLELKRPGQSMSKSHA